MRRKFFAIYILLFILAAHAAITLPSVEAAPAYADGEYKVSFEVLKDTSDDISATSEYMENSATIKITDGIAYAEVTLNNSSWWQYFKTQTGQSSAFTDATVVRENSDNDTRVVKFQVNDAGQPVHAKIHVIVTGIPGFVYDNKYDIRLKFDDRNIPTAKEPVQTEREQELEQEQETETAPEIKPDATPKPGSEQSGSTPPKEVKPSPSATETDTASSEPKATDAASQLPETTDSPSSTVSPTEAVTEVPAATDGFTDAGADPDLSDHTKENEEHEASPVLIGSTDAAEESAAENASSGFAGLNIVFVFAVVVIGAGALALIIFRKSKRRS